MEERGEESSGGRSEDAFPLRVRRRVGETERSANRVLD
jgi:hypothetical protein